MINKKLRYYNYFETLHGELNIWTDCFNLICEMINQSAFIVKALFKILMTCFISEKNKIKVEHTKKTF